LLTSTDVLTSDTSQLGECEFAIIAELHSQMIIHHPYRSLSEIQTALQLTVDEMSLAWNIINDHYLTDLPLLHAPHVIAVTAAFLAVVIKPSTSGGGAAPPGNMHHQVQGALGNLGGGAGAAGSSAGGSQGATNPAASARVQKMLNWLAEGNVNIEAIVDCVQELISLYEVWDGYKEALCKEPIARFVKARGLEK
jgi:cyclin-C